MVATHPARELGRQHPQISASFCAYARVDRTVCAAGRCPDQGWGKLRKQLGIDTQTFGDQLAIAVPHAVAGAQPRGVYGRDLDRAERDLSRAFAGDAAQTEHHGFELACRAARALGSQASLLELGRGGVVKGREQQRFAVGEVLVEGLARDLCRGYEVGDGRGGIAVLVYRLHHRVDQAVTLVGRNLLGLELVRTARKLSSASMVTRTYGHYASAVFAPLPSLTGC